MRIGVASWLLASALAFASAKADEQKCGEWIRLSVDPAGKTGDVAAVLRRRLAAASARAPLVEMDGGLRVMLPAGVSESVLTQPAKIEFRLVAKSPEEPGAVVLPRRDGNGSESVEPQIIVNERRLREVKVVEASGSGAVAIAFRFDPEAVKNLLAATVDAVGRKLAIIVDDQIVVDPIIRAPLASVEGEISGAFTKSYASQLVDLLRNGRLDGRVAIVSRAPAPCATP